MKTFRLCLLTTVSMVALPFAFASWAYPAVVSAVTGPSSVRKDNKVDAIVAYRDEASVYCIVPYTEFHKLGPEVEVTVSWPTQSGRLSSTGKTSSVILSVNEKTTTSIEKWWEECGNKASIQLRKPWSSTTIFHFKA